MGIQALRRNILYAVIIGATGALWVIFEGNFENLLALNIGRGELIFFVGCVSHALYAVFIPVLNSGESSIIQTSGVLIFGLIVCSLGANQILKTSWLSLSALVIFSIFYL